MRDVALLTIFVGLVAVVFAKPYVGIYLFSWISYMNPHRMTFGFAYSFQFAMLAAVATILAWLISKEPKKLPLTPITIIFLLFIIWISVTTLFALVPESANESYLLAIKILFMVLLTIVLINNRERLNGLLWVIVISIGFFGLKGGVFSILTGGMHRIYGPSGSFIEENNALAVATLVIVPLTTYLASQTRYLWVKYFMLASVPILLISCIASYSRGGFLAFIVMIAFFWFRSRKKFVTGAIGVIVLTAIFLFMPERYYDRISTLESYEEDHSALSRLDAWSFAWNVAKDNPILGGGFDIHKSQQAWDQYKPDAVRLRVNLHNIYFQILSNHGFVGFFMYFAIYFGSFLTLQRIRRKTVNIAGLNWAYGLSGMLQVSMVAFAAGGMFLNLAFFDLPWHLVAMAVILNEIVKRGEKETAEPGDITINNT